MPQSPSDSFLKKFFYWQLTECPPDRSVACQADLPLDTDMVYEQSAPNCVDAETQVNPGDVRSFNIVYHNESNWETINFSKNMKLSFTVTRRRR